jgi:catechol 2,3-dioxygenase-like lactoylglutathione lyase family enzyme
MRPRLQSLDHLVLTVADIPRSLGFYETVLGMVPERFTPVDGTTRWALMFGTHKINLHQAGAEFEPKADHPTTGSADLCFLTENPLSEWQDHLERQGIEVIEGPVPRTGATGPLVSIYLRDPDGNLLEISNKTAG